MNGCLRTVCLFFLVAFGVVSLGDVSPVGAATRISLDPEVQSITAGEEVSMSCTLEPDGEVFGVGMVVRYDPDQVRSLKIQNKQLPQGANLVAFDDGKGTFRISVVSSRELLVTDPKMFDVSMVTTSSSHGDLPVRASSRGSDGEGNRLPVEMAAGQVSVYNPNVSEEEWSETSGSEESAQIQQEERDVEQGRRTMSVARGTGWSHRGEGGDDRFGHRGNRSRSSVAGKSTVALSDGLMAMLSPAERKGLEASLSDGHSRKGEPAGISAPVKGRGRNYTYRTSYGRDGKLVLDLQVGTGAQSVQYALVDGVVFGRQVQGNGKYSYTIKKTRDTARFALVLGDEYVWIDL